MNDRERATHFIEDADVVRGAKAAKKPSNQSEMLKDPVPRPKENRVRRSYEIVYDSQVSRRVN